MPEANRIFPGNPWRDVPSDEEAIALICGHDRYPSRRAALVELMAGPFGKPAGLSKVSRAALFLSQVLHESGRLRYVKEVWGPTAAQRRYEGRRDLGNTQPGDGFRFRGRDIIQVTGRANYTALTKWANENGFLEAGESFADNPELLEEPRYFGLGAVWYWQTRVPVSYIEAGNIEMITRRINGGLNGYSDRLDLFTRAGLVFCGYKPDEVAAFQEETLTLKVDGIPGEKTRREIFLRLKTIENTTRLFNPEEPPAPPEPPVPPVPPKPPVPPRPPVPVKPAAPYGGGLWDFLRRIFGGR